MANLKNVKARYYATWWHEIWRDSLSESSWRILNLIQIIWIIKLCAKWVRNSFTISNHYWSPDKFFKVFSLYPLIISLDRHLPQLTKHIFNEILGIIETLVAFYFVTRWFDLNWERRHASLILLLVCLPGSNNLLRVSAKSSFVVSTFFVRDTFLFTPRKLIICSKITSYLTLELVLMMGPDT